MPGREAVSTLHWAKNEILSFFKFLQKKVSRLDKENFLHLLNLDVFPHAFCKLQPPKLYKMCRSFIVKPENFFLQKFKKWQNVIFGPM